VAELADAQDSGSCVRKDVRVQVPLRPPSAGLSSKLSRATTPTMTVSDRTVDDMSANSTLHQKAQIHQLLSGFASLAAGGVHEILYGTRGGSQGHPGGLPST
jgi:hypothetical protein